MSKEKNHDINKLYCFVCNEEIDILEEKRKVFNANYNQDVDLCSKKCFKLMNNSRYGRGNKNE